MNMPDKYVFEKLTPISNSDLGIYENALNFVWLNHFSCGMSKVDN